MRDSSSTRHGRWRAIRGMRGKRKEMNLTMTTYVAASPVI